MIVLGAAWWAVALYAAAAVAITASMILLPMVLGQRHRERTTGERYESGLPPAGDLPRRFSLGFYLVAILFVVFDLEAVFIFAWAVAARDLGWIGYLEIVVFVALLVAALVYLWGTGALDWAAGSGKRLSGRTRR